MKAIPVFNPSPLGKAFVAPRRAAEYIRKGRAIMRPDGKLQFTVAAHAALVRYDTETRAFNDAFKAGRTVFDEKGNPVDMVVYWNGVFPNASFPPGCNVHFRRPGVGMSSFGAKKCAAE